MNLAQAKHSAHLVWTAADEVARMCQSDEAQEAAYELRKLAWEAEKRVIQKLREEAANG
jgi:hypothetical protein